MIKLMNLMKAIECQNFNYRLDIKKVWHILCPFNKSLLDTVSTYLLSYTCIPLSLVLFITLILSLSMPSISQQSLIFPCYNTALPSFMTISMLLCYGISFLLLSLSPSFSICMSILISDVLLLFQSLSFALFDLLNWLIASLSLPLFLHFLNSLLIYPSHTSTIYLSCSIFLHLLLYLTFPSLSLYFCYYFFISTSLSLLLHSMQSLSMLFLLFMVLCLFSLHLCSVVNLHSSHALSRSHIISHINLFTYCLLPSL